MFSSLLHEALPRKTTGWLTNARTLGITHACPMPIRYTITFAGQVQGVGFRYTTVNVASGYRVSGWVRNERDGSVQCVAEGEQPELDRFVAAVQQAMQGYIGETRIASDSATGEFSGFAVRR